MSTESYRIYFAGELFSFKHLIGNAALANGIHRMSAGKYRCVLPQNLEQRETTALAIRNQDLHHVATCDLGLFHFDGPELDSGTVVEFMAAKFLDIPTVIIRSDFRLGGDGQDPWNLMVSNYPRTKTILVDSMALTQKELHALTKDKEDEIAVGNFAFDSNLRAIESFAKRVVGAFDEVLAEPPVLKDENRDAVYRWFTDCAGGDFKKLLSHESASELAQVKKSRGLL